MRPVRTSVGGLPVFARTWTGASGAERRPPIVLVHGIAVSSRYMVPLGERLGARFDVYAPDLPGFGRSGRPREVLDVPRLADSLGAWLDALRLERPVLVGNSNGCQVIVALAARGAGRCAGLVLNGPTVDDEHRAVLPELGRLLLDAPRERWSIIPLNVRDYLRAGLRRSIGTLRHAIADRPEDSLPRVAEPVLVVRGGRDPIVSQRWAERLTACARHGRLVTVPGAPHAMNYSRPDELAALIEEFVRGL